MAIGVVFVDHALALGGAERSLLLVLKHLDRAHLAPRLACTGGPLAEQATALGIPVHIVPLGRLRRSPLGPVQWLSGARALARQARETRAALLVANTVRAAVYTSLAARLAGIPFVWHMRDFYLSESRPRHLWADRLGKGLLCRSAVRVLANSRVVAEGLPCPGKVTVIHNGIEVGRYDPGLDGRPFRTRYGIPPEAPVVGVVGRLRPWKGQERFLRAMASVAEHYPSARFAVVGGAIFEVNGDDYPARLRRLADELGLGERAVFTGQLDDVRPALAALDVFVHPGDPEPFGLVNIEAMAMGRPVVAFAHGALPEIVLDGETGLLVAPGDEAALAAAVVGLLGSPARRREMGQAGRTCAEQCFTAERMAAEVALALSQALSRG